MSYMNGKLVWQIIGDYLRGLLFGGIFFYLFTARPDGTIQLTWNWLNLTLLLSYFFFYPLNNYRHFRLRHLWQMKGFASQAMHRNLADHQQNDRDSRSATNPMGNRYNLTATTEKQDDGLNILVSFVTSGLLILIAIPFLIIDLIFKAIKPKRQAHH